ncbi:hypothetical protein HDU79_010775 [Rhizoclosmatium sp. JEL0117]|nr:hypothetical protein HDU79_010775 [Rhizoclosmatium sp. JEL0117]
MNTHTASHAPALMPATTKPKVFDALSLLAESAALVEHELGLTPPPTESSTFTHSHSHSPSPRLTHSLRSTASPGATVSTTAASEATVTVTHQSSPSSIDHLTRQPAPTTATSTTSTSVFILPPTNGAVRATKPQIAVLARVFKTTPLPSTEMQKELAQSVGMTVAQVRNWFQNNRAKVRREEKEKGVNDNDDGAKKRRLNNQPPHPPSTPPSFSYQPASFSFTPSYPPASTSANSMSIASLLC